MAQIIESFTKGKRDDAEINEDGIVDTPHFMCVRDGATSRAGDTLGGMRTGRFAAQTVARHIAQLPPDIEAAAAVAQLTIALAEATSAAAKAEGKTVSRAPATALLLYSVQRREIWRLADSIYGLDGVMHENPLELNTTWGEMRRIYLCSCIARGTTEEDLRRDDPSYAILTRVMGEMGGFPNYNGPYGYGVLNGSAVNDCHIDVVPVGDAVEIVLASDGYPKVFSTLAETEAYLATVLAEDPLMFKRHPQAKGVAPGAVSFDDRSYIRFSV